MCQLSRNLGACTFWNPVGLPRPVIGLLYLYLYKIERGGACDTHGAEDAYRVLMGAPEGRRSFGRPRYRLQCNITVVRKEIGWTAWGGFVWFRKETSGRLLRTFFFLKFGKFTD
jgi:hypothetical protein